MLQTLLVDDDILSLNRLQTYLANLDFIHVCNQMTDGCSTLDYLKQEGAFVDVILLDMELPGASGLQIADFIRRAQLPITVLVISNYDNFEYVKPVLQAGAYDYLLKHELSKSLLETKLTEIRQYREHQQLHRKHMEQMSQLSKQQYLHDLALNYDISEERHNFFASDPLFTGRRHVAACLQITNYSNIYQSLTDESPQKIIDTVLHFCDTFFTALQQGIITHIRYGEFLVIFSFPNISSEATLLLTAASNINLLQNNMKRYLSIHTLTESMPVYDSVRNIRPYYLKIHHQLQIKPFSGNLDGKEETEDTFIFPLSLQREHELSEALLHPDEKKVMEIINQIFESINQSQISLLRLQRLIVRLTEIMQLALQTAGQEVVLLEPPAVKNILELDKLREQFILYYEAGLKQLASVSIAQYTPLIQKALSYIFQNYHTDISLTAISRHCGVSESYFSRVFKDTLGLPFTKYLNSYRVKIAAQRLCQTSESIKKISEDTGFQNYNYFLTVFKNYMGVTPIQYRERGSLL